MPEKAKVFFIDRNVHGAWVVYGSEGIKHYYGYTMAEANMKPQPSSKRRNNNG